MTTEMAPPATTEAALAWQPVSRPAKAMPAARQTVPRSQYLRSTQIAVTRPGFWPRAVAVSAITAGSAAVATVAVHFLMQLCQR